jgi:hypothetical protein
VSVCGVSSMLDKFKTLTLAPSVVPPGLPALALCPDDHDEEAAPVPGNQDVAYRATTGRGLSSQWMLRD